MVKTSKPKQIPEEKSAVGESHWYAPSNIIALGAVLVSIIALDHSCESNRIAKESIQIARDALILTKKEYEGQRSLVLTATVATNQDELYLSSTEPSSVLEKAYITFPNSFSITNWDVMPPDYGFALLLPRQTIQQYEEKTHPLNDKFYQVSSDSAVPFIIRSVYSSHGDSHSITSLYLLNYSLVIGSEHDREPVKVTFLGISLVGHYSSNELADRDLAILWEQWPMRQK